MNKRKLTHILNQITKAEACNRKIYFFKKIPWFNKKISDRIYAAYHIKSLISKGSTLLAWLGVLIGQALFVGLFLVVPVLVLQKDSSSIQQLNSLIHVYMVYSLIVGPLLVHVIAASREAYVLVRLFHVDCKTVALSIISRQYRRTLPCYFIMLVVALIGLKNDAPIALALMMSLAYIVFHLGGEALNLFVFKVNRNWMNRAVVMIVVFILGVLAAYGPLVLNITWNSVGLLTHPLFSFGLVVLGIGSIHYLMNYSHYTQFMYAGFERNKSGYDMESLMNQSRFQDVRMQDKDEGKPVLKAQNKHGYDYLNTIFIARHDHLLKKPIRKRLLLISAVLLICGGVLALMTERQAAFMDELLSLMPMFVFLMYMLNGTEKLTRAMFANCDIALLRYSWYRQPQVILKNYLIRLKIVVAYNLACSTLICLGVFLITFILNITVAWSLMLLFVMDITLLSLLFSVHFLSMYYLFQPFTSDQGMKSPLYTLINSGVSMLCFIMWTIETAPSFFALGLCVVTTIYILCALVAVWKLAPKTFRIK